MKVSVVARKLSPNIGFSLSIAEGLRNCGLAAQAFTDDDPEVVRADLVLFVGQPASCRKTVRRIEAAGDARPGVAAWLFEPLPPPELPLEEIRSAARYSAIRSGTRWLRPVIQLMSRPHDIALDLRSGRSLGPLGMRFLIDNASFVLRGRDYGWLDGLFVSTEQKRLQLTTWDIAADFLPVGQQRDFGRDLGLRRDIDVLFIGSVKNRRRQVALEKLFGDLRSRGLNVLRPEGGVWGDARTQLVNRAKILLHLHQYDWDTPWMRWCLAAANGAVVASEPLSVPQPFVRGADYLEAPIDHLPDAIANLAADERRRIEMLGACRATIALHMTQAAAIERLAEALRMIAAQRRTA